MVSIKIKNVLNLNSDFQKNFVLIAGKEGIQNEITGINVMEVPDGVYWVSKDEFIISTGYSISRGDVSLEYIIKMLIKRGAAGLGIKTGRFIDTISEDIIELCNNYNFPLIKINSTFSYTDIISPINDVLYSKSCNSLKQNLANNLLNFNDIFDPVDYLEKKLSEFFEKDIYIINDSQCLYFFKHSNIDVNNLIKKNYAFIEEYNKFYHFEEDRKYYDIIKIESINNISWFICISSDLNFDFCDLEKDTIIQSSYLISLYLVKDLTEFFYPLTENSPIALVKFFNNNLSKEEFLRDSLAIRLAKNYKMFVLAIDFDSIDESGRNVIKLEIWKQLLKNDDYGYFNDVYCILVITEQKIIDEVFKIVKKYGLHMGISRKCENIAYIDLAYEEAVFALNLGKINSPSSLVHFYDNLIIYHLVFQLRNHSAMIKNYKNTIIRLLDYDKNNDGNLLLTLKTLIDNDFNISESSNSLYIHRNTLYKRMDRISGIVDMDFSNNSKIILIMCYKLYEMLNAKFWF